VTFATLVETGWLRMPAWITRSALEACPTDGLLDADDAGSRNLLADAWCSSLVAPLRSSLQEAGVLPNDAVAVQCILFRKTQACNWKVPYHQDLSIPVAARVKHAALSGWSVKQDGEYVHCPTALLDRMLAVRLHLDPCGVDQGALRVVPGSHRLGRLAPERIAAMDKRRDEIICTADAGDLLLMRPLLLHASSKAAKPDGRRVLHFLFAPPAPDFGLHWRIAV
jgi:hypothetical protein